MNKGSKNYIKSFDTLRVIALLGVFLYHLMPSYVPSGYLGVVIFFVLAGFLTMKNTMDQSSAGSKNTLYDGVNKIKGKIFKLHPVLLFTVLMVTIFMCACFKNFLMQYPADAVSSILFFNNYTQILRNESYFEAMNTIKPLTHVWALSLEFQFYAAFFLCVYPFYKKENENKYFIGFLLLTILSIVISIYLVLNGVNLTRIYYGFDSRLATFLLGAIGAIFASKISGVLKKTFAFAKLVEAILIVILVYAMVVNFSTDMQVIEIIIIYSILTTILLILLYNDDKIKTDTSKVDDKGLIRASGIASAIVTGLVKRSYVIYLVHYPIIIFSNRFFAHMQVDIKIFFLLMIIVTVVISELVYRIVEVLFSRQGDNKKSWILIAIMSGLVLAVSLFIKISLPNAPKLSGQNDTTWLTGADSEGTKENVGADENNQEINELYDVASMSEISNEEADVNGIYDADGKLLISHEELYSYKVQEVFRKMNRVNTQIGGDAILTREEFLEYRNMKITIIGDSVTQCAKESLEFYFPNAVIDAAGNRQLDKALSIFYDIKERGELGDIVVVALGTNSDKEIRTDVLEEIYENLDDRVMIILTVAIPYVAQEQQRNTAIRKFADSHDNCHLADWYGAIKTHKECFVGDDTHPTGVGNDTYAQLIFKTAIGSLEWKKVGNEWQYFGGGNKMKFAIELDKNVGDTVKFGNYYINDVNDKEQIEWIIIDKNEDLKTEILLSKYVIDRKKFEERYINTTWQRSDIRKWLNGEFYNIAFENIGAKFILTSVLDNHRNPEYQTAEADKTYDKVYMPSYNDIKKYLGDNLRCKGTEYFKRKGGYVDRKGYADWWTRTAGDADNHMMNVSASGEIVMKGDYVTTDDFGVRPMIKVSYK